MADFKTLNVNNGTWDVKDETARNDIGTINNTIDNTITPSLATLNNNKASHTDLTNAIEALDYADSVESGKYVSAVNETDGVISVTKDSLPTKLSDFTDDVVAGNYQPICSSTSVSTASYELTANASTMACEIPVLKGFNIIRVGISVPNDVSDTDFTAIFSLTSGSSSVATGTAQHQYIGGPIGTNRTVLDFVYSGVFPNDATFYCNVMHNNANNISVFSFARVLNIPM